MTNDIYNRLPEPLKEVAKQYPDSVKPGTVLNNVADASWRLAKAHGLDPQSPEFAEFVASQIEQAPGATPAQQGGGTRVRLSAEEMDAARISRISPQEYATAREEARKAGVLGRYSSKGY
jgi:hypothetical protein